MDRIFIRNIKVFGYHGVLPVERADGQDFLIDVDMLLDASKAAASDNLEDTVDYTEVFNLVKKVVKGEPVNLIERLGDLIAREILSGWSMVQKVKVTVQKPDIPLPGEFGAVGVQVERSRDEL